MAMNQETKTRFTNCFIDEDLTVVPLWSIFVRRCLQSLKDVDEERLLQLTESAASLAKAVSPPLEDESDVESISSFKFGPKAVDLPSAVRLAKRLFTLDGFKKSDVSRHLSKKLVNLVLSIIG